MWTQTPRQLQALRNLSVTREYILIAPLYLKSFFNHQILFRVNLRRVNDVLVLGIRLTDPPVGYELQKVAVAKFLTTLAGKIFGDVVPGFKVSIS